MSDQNVIIKNNLSTEIQVYDAFQENKEDKSITNFFGTLTDLVVISPNKSEDITPIHSPISTYILYDMDQNPIKRIFAMGGGDQPTFTVGQEDLDIMASTKSFIQLLNQQPKDPLAVQFNALIKGGNPSPKDVNDFFKKTSNYSNCTFISYMLEVVAMARTPDTVAKPPQEQKYSLSSLVKYFGFDWPEGIPDIVVSEFHCSETDKALQIGGKLNVQGVTFGDGVLKHVESILPNLEVNFQVTVVTQAGLSVGTTVLKFTYDDLKIPIGGGKDFELDKPTVMLMLNPLFKFVVFQIKAEIPFNIFNSPTIDADVSLTVDNVEAAVGVELKGNKTTLLTPPGIKGLHFDSFGVGLGLFFTPPGLAIGLQGAFHIGEGKSIPLDDDQFAIVCQMEEEVPNPLFLSFYVPKLELGQVVTLFTDTSVGLDLPVSFSDLSFRWSENPMEPVVLPDGSLSQGGYGFSGNLDLFGLGFYGVLDIDLNKGVSGLLTMSPLSVGKVLQISGDGKAVSLKIDANGNPVRNNAIPKTAKDKKAIADATSKQIIAPGGPELSISTSSSPYFSMDAQVSLLNLVHEKIDAKITKTGIQFELDYGSVIESKLACTLSDWKHLNGSFSYGIDLKISLPSVLGFHLGSIHLDTGCDVGISIALSSSEEQFAVQGGFHFEGIHHTFGPFQVSVDISQITDLLKEVENYILSHVGDIFKDLIKDAQQWANLVKKVVIAGVKDVAKGLKQAFGKSPDQVASIMHTAGYGMEEVAKGLQSAFSTTGTVIANALKSAFGATSSQIAGVFNQMGIGAKETALALEAAFGLGPSAIKDVLVGAGYAENAIKDAFESIGGAFKSFADDLWGAIKHWDHWS